MQTILALLTFTVVAAFSAHADETKPKPEFQYQSEGIEVPAATADEPRVKAFGDRKSVV